VRPSLSLRRKRHASTGTRDDVTCAVTCSRGRRRAASAVPRSPRGPENESLNNKHRRLSRSGISGVHLLHCVEQRRALVVVLRVHCGTVLHERFAHRHMPARQKRGFMHRTHVTRLIPPPSQTQQCRKGRHEPNTRIAPLHAKGLGPQEQKRSRRPLGVRVTACKIMGWRRR
jgi:hypothetical protein